MHTLYTILIMGFFISVFLFLATLVYIGFGAAFYHFRDRRVDLMAHREICMLNQMFYSSTIEEVTYDSRNSDRGHCTSTAVYRCELAHNPDCTGCDWSGHCSGAHGSGVVHGG